MKGMCIFLNMQNNIICNEITLFVNVNENENNLVVFFFLW